MNKLKKAGIWLLGVVGLVLAIWAIMIGPVSAWRVVTHGTTTVWDHLEYPGRVLTPSDNPSLWSLEEGVAFPDQVVVDGATVDFDDLLSTTDSLAFVAVKTGAMVDEWYAPDHGPEAISMLFSVTKSIFSLMIGAAIDDGLIDSVEDPVSRYLPELADAGFDSVTLEDMLRMDSSLDYVEGDNPFGLHVEFNYTPDLAERILELQVREVPDPQFRYKSGDNAVLGLILDRVLGEVPITGYMQRRLWDPLGMETAGIWGTDRADGLERTWCCLAMSARDLARFGVLVQNAGIWNDSSVVSKEWVTNSARPGFESSRWPADYQDSTLVNYGYHWWLTDSDGLLALGKDGQYLYLVGPDLVMVRLGESQGDVSWIEVMDQVASSLVSCPLEALHYSVGLAVGRISPQ